MKPIRDIHGVKYFKYTVSEYQFVNLVKDLFGVDDLSRVHEVNPDKEINLFNLHVQVIIKIIF